MIPVYIPVSFLLSTNPICITIALIKGIGAVIAMAFVTYVAVRRAISVYNFFIDALFNLIYYNAFIN